MTLNARTEAAGAADQARLSSARTLPSCRTAHHRESSRAASATGTTQLRIAAQLVPPLRGELAPQTIQATARRLIKREPLLAAQLAQALLTVDDPLWVAFFTLEFGVALAAQRNTEATLLRHLLQSPAAGAPAALWQYLRVMPSDSKTRFMAPAALRRASHPAGPLVVSSFGQPGTPEAVRSERLLGVLLAYGAEPNAICQHTGAEPTTATAWFSERLLPAQAEAGKAQEAVITYQAAIASGGVPRLVAALLTLPLSLNVALVLSCARDNHWLGEALLRGGLAEQIMRSPEQEKLLLTTLCTSPSLAFAAEVVAAYLEYGGPALRERLFEPALLRKKVHPVNICFAGAATSGPAGTNLLRVLRVFIAYGLPLEITVGRNATEIQRAASLVHAGLLKLVAESGCAMPDNVIECIMKKSARCAEAISFLVDECAVPLDRFLAPKLLNKAQREARVYVNARRARCARIPESTPLEDDDFDDVHA